MLGVKFECLGIFFLETQIKIWHKLYLKKNLQKENILKKPVFLSVVAWREQSHAILVCWMTSQNIFIVIHADASFWSKHAPVQH